MVVHSRYRTVWFVLLVLASLWCIAAVQDPDFSDLHSWERFLTWLTEPSGVTLGAGVILSILFEYAPGYAGLTKKHKRIVFATACMLVPVAGAVLGVLTLSWSPGWSDTFWPAIVTGVFAFGTGTMAHTPRLPDAPPPVSKTARSAPEID